MALSSSGLGHQVLILVIAGSNPAKVTIGYVMGGTFLLDNDLYFIILCKLIYSFVT